MTWVKMDDQRALNKKLRRAGFAARGLDEAAICQISCDGSDGFIDDDTVAMLAGAHGEKDLDRLTSTLVSVGRWERDDDRGGFHVRAYLEFNPSHADAVAYRAERAEAGRRGGLQSGLTRRREARAEAVAVPRASANGRARAHPAETSEDVSVASHNSPSPPDLLFEALGEATASANGQAIGQAKTNPVPSRPVETSKDVSIASRKNRTAPDLLFEAIAAGCELRLGDITRTLGAQIGKARRDLQSVGATPEEVALRAERYHRLWPEMSLTPSALEKHWAALGPECEAEIIRQARARAPASRNGSTIDASLARATAVAGARLSSLELPR